METPRAARALLLAPLLSVLLWACPGFAAEVTGITIQEFGLYELVRVPSATGQSDTTELALVQHTDRVPARLGTKFGVRYLIDGSPLGARVDITVVTRFPEGGIKDPETATVREADRQEIESAVGDVRFLGFELSKPWELVPGAWRFELWSGEKKMAEKVFHIGS